MRFIPLIFLVLPLITTLEAQSSSSPQVTINFATGDSIDGLTNSNARFVTFGNPAFNGLNGVAFQASVREIINVTNGFPWSAPRVWITNHFTNTWSGIWSDDSSGNRKLIVRSGDLAPLWKGAGFFSAFASFSDPVYNNSNAIAFVGKSTSQNMEYLVAPIGGYPPDVTGIWTTQIFPSTNTAFISTNSTLTNNHPFITPVFLPYPINLTYVTSLGSQAPGYSNNSTFSSFDRIALPEQGGVVLLATVTTFTTNYPTKQPNKANPQPAVKSTSQQGIWAQDTAGTLQLIARQGGTMNVGGSNKTIATLSFLNSTNSLAGQTRSFSQDTGNLFYTATFIDGTQAGVKVIFP